MRLSRFFTLTLLVIAGLVLASCSGVAPQTVTVVETVEVEKVVEKEVIKEVPAEPEVITIEYWQYFFDARVDAMNRLIQQFEAQNPDVRVIHNSDIPYADFRDKIAASAPAGVGPDVVTLFYGWIPAWVEAGYIVPLPEEDFPPEMIETEFSPMVANSKFQGKYWAIPTAVRTLALFWNKDLFAQAGLDPESPPKTLDEFVDYAQQLTQYDDNGNIVIEGFAPGMPGQAHHWFREVLVRQFGGVPYSDDNRTVMWNSPEGCEAFKWLADFEIKYNTGSNDLFEDATTAFLQGKAALHIDGSFRLGSIERNAPDLNFGVAELPAQLAAAGNEDLLADPKLGAFAAGLPYAHATFFVDESKQRQHLIDAFDAVRLTGEDPCVALNDAAELEQELLDEFWAKQ